MFHSAIGRFSPFFGTLEQHTQNQDARVNSARVVTVEMSHNHPGDNTYEDAAAAADDDVFSV